MSSASRQLIRPGGSAGKRHRPDGTEIADDEMGAPPPPEPIDIASLMASLQHDTQHTVAAGILGMDTKFHKTFEAGFTKFKHVADARFEAIEQDVQCIAARQSSLESNMAVQKTQMEKLVNQLALAEKVLQPTARDIGFDRKIITGHGSHLGSRSMHKRSNT